MLTKIISDLPKILSIIQIGLSALLIVCVLLQQRGAGSSAIMGGGGGGASYYTKRGFEKALSYAIVILAVLFIVAAIASVYIVAKY